MAIIKWTPFLPWEEFERGLIEKGFTPAMDVYKEGNNLVAKTPIVGFDPKKVDISVKNGMLTIKGSTEKKSEVEEKNYYRKEIKSGSFYRSILLPAEVEAEKLKAEYQDGILKITMPMKKVLAKKVKVAVKKGKAKKIAKKK
jgi:HSP20 family protein